MPIAGDICWISPKALVEFLQVSAIEGIQVYQLEFLADCTVKGSSFSPIVSRFLSRGRCGRSAATGRTRDWGGI